MTIFQCNNCRGRTQFNLRWSENEPAGMIFAAHLCQECGHYLFTRLSTNGSGGDPLIFWPPTLDSAHRDIPAEVRGELDEAIAALNAGLSKLALIGARAALQAAMREQSAKGNDLKAEIADLVDRHVLMPALGDWANEVRLAGNLGAHPRPGVGVSDQEAREILALADSIFDYLYVVPAAVQRRKSATGTP